MQIIINSDRYISQLDKTTKIENVCVFQHDCENIFKILVLILLWAHIDQTSYR